MFSFEDGAGDIIDAAVDRYENYFGEIFPLHEDEYASKTEGNGYDFSLSGSKKLADFIDQRIKENKPVLVPNGYENRDY